MWVLLRLIGLRRAVHDERVQRRRVALGQAIGEASHPFKGERALQYDRLEDLHITDAVVQPTEIRRQSRSESMTTRAVCNEESLTGAYGRRIPFGRRRLQPAWARAQRRLRDGRSTELECDDPIGVVISRSGGVCGGGPG